MVDSAEIPGSQQIRLFVGDSANITSRSFSNKDLAGVAAIFSSKLTTDSSANRLLNITVPLTQILVDKKIGLRPEDVVPRLAKDLHWVVEQVSSLARSLLRKGSGSYVASADSTAMCTRLTTRKRPFRFRI